MIIGIGTDIVDASRIEKICNRVGVRFLQRIYTISEQEEAEQRGQRRINFLASRFAAKEAVWKAINADRKAIIALKDIEILPDQAGAPKVILHGTALTAAHTKTEKNWKIDVSLSDESGLALAFVVFYAP